MASTIPAALPELSTGRLRLRAFTLADAPAIQRLAGEREVAANTLTIPHPYPDGAAEAWVLSQPGLAERGEGVTLALERVADGALVGAIGLMISGPDARAELGYWIGKPYWGLGYATEAAAAFVAYGFRSLRLERIHAAHFTRNPASGRVLQKLGMRHEGCQRRHIRKWGVFEDLELYGLLREEWQAEATASPAASPVP